MKKTKKISRLIALALSFILLSQSALYAKTNPVSITTPTFPVRLNGFYTGDDEFFPIIVYKDITYIPLTQDMAERLNLWVWWDNDARTLSIKKHPVRNSFPATDFGAPSKQIKSHYKASIPTYPIIVNGKKLDLAKEPYPVLNFNNITYFPLTWRFAVNEFGWKYQYSKEEGLQIFSLNYDPALIPNTKVYGDNDKPLNHNPASLPQEKESKVFKMPLSAFKEPFYYHDKYIYSFIREKETVQFWKKSLNGKDEIIGSTEIAGKNVDGFHYTTAFPNGSLVFTSHFGGATMGSEKHYLLTENGVAKQLSDKRFTFLDGYDKGFVGSLFNVTGPQEGLVKIDFTGKHHDFGKKGFYYSNGVIQDDTLYALVGESNSASPLSLYAIDLESGKHEQLVDHVFDFVVDENDIFFRKENGKELYRYHLPTKKIASVASLFDKQQSYFTNGTELFSIIRLPQSAGTSEKANLYRENNGKWELLAKEIIKPIYSDSHLVYLQPTANGQFVVITDQAGKMLHKIIVGNKQVDYFLDGDDLIIWSWQDQMVRYYELER